MEFVGCALVLFNWHPAIGVLLLMVFTIVASGLLLRFWEVQGPMRTGLQNGMLANVGVVGGLAAAVAARALNRSKRTAKRAPQQRARHNREDGHD